MEQDEVVRRLKGLSRTQTPAAPDFTSPLAPVAGRMPGRFGMGPIVAVVGVLALATAALAVPDNGPLRQVVASLSTEVETDVAEVEGDLDADESGVSGSGAVNPCEGAPPTGTPADAAGDDGLAGGATVEVDPEDREAQVEAWNEWREANCGPEANSTDDDDDSDESDDSDDADGSNGHGRGQGDGANGTHPHEDDPCKGPPPHSNSPNNGQPERSADERHAEHEAWKQWHHENCPAGQANDHPGHDQGHGRPDDAGKPDDGGKPDHAGRSDDEGEHEEGDRPDGADRPDHADEDTDTDTDADEDEDEDEDAES